MGNEWHGITVPPGIDVRANENQTASLSFRFRDGGGRQLRSQRIAVSPDDLKDARLRFEQMAAKRAEVLAAITLGTFDYAKAFPHSKRARILNNVSSYTLQTWGEHFIAQLKKTQGTKKGLTEASVQQYESTLSCYWYPKIGGVPLSDLRKEHITRAYANYGDYARATLGNMHAALRAALAYAVSWNEIAHNPIDGIKLAKLFPGTKADDRVIVIDPYDADERRALVKACHEIYPQVADAVEVWFYTGLRPEEMFALEWPEVNLDKGLLRVCRVLDNTGKIRERAKNKESLRDVPLSTAAVEAFKRLKGFTFLGPAGERRYVFPNPTTRQRWVKSNKAGAFWRRIHERAGVRYRPIKQIRHTYATMLWDQVDHRKITLFMGHKNTEQLYKVYASKLTKKDREVSGESVAAVNWG